MSSRKAVDHFLGRNGAQRMNCAESVALVFKDKGLFSDDEFKALANCGSGRAPNGYCGSVYSAMLAVSKISPPKAGQLEAFFASNAGSLECGVIRKQRKMKCADCVEKAAEFVESVLAERE